ncbi:hypothetical protein EC973_004775 [Apophysomyces ossiformis]|uniref:Uncharacterized protein n=1 Tax=Apophysomyces ossiformis TaxID=679940 RepID=A0A8H7EUV4_9FUNG|nr:hypothetical protein EC973_004775 [Apophysomyces ossiformis]
MFPRVPGQGDETGGWADKLCGKTVIGDDEETSLSPDEFVRPKDFPAPYRLLKPNAMMTMDYNPSRLNIRLDKLKRIIGVHYG